MRRSAAVNVVAHYPKTGEGNRRLAQRVAAVHTEAAKSYIENSSVPSLVKNYTDRIGSRKAT